MKRLIFLALILGILVVMSSGKHYKNHQVIRASPKSTDELALLKELPRIGGHDEFGWWQEPAKVGAHVDFRVAPALAKRIRSLLQSHNIDHHVWVKDVHPLILSQKEKRANPESEFAFNQYHDYHEIVDWMTQISANRSDIVQMFKIGMSFENRPMYALRITSQNGNREKPGIFIDAGIHAREWIAPATVLYMANELITQYGIEKDVTSFVDEMEWIFLPVFNVDGYQYTWDHDRMWRKSRKPNDGSHCIGVDINRNWDIHWGDSDGSSDDPCSETYAGPSAFSEPEAKQVADYILSKKNLRAYINFHAYSQMWMSPWGWTTKDAVDFDVQNSVSQKAVEALQSVYGTDYAFGETARTIYPASGIVNDWVYGVAGVKYSYTVELRDNGWWGFLLPPNQIVPSGVETWKAVSVVAEAVLKEDRNLGKRKAKKMLRGQSPSNLH